MCGEGGVCGCFFFFPVFGVRSTRLELDQINQEYIEEGALVISADSALRL